MDQDSKDANSLIIELDRGLQSPNVGEQSESIVRFSRLLHRLPLPLLINSACLKLAEAYRCGTNFIRMQICEVFERNQTHLNKIYNVEDFYRSIFTVTTSNDPIARSITLLTLGNIAPVVSEYKCIHHCIIGSLESKVECELNAAITCAASYVKYSSEFACNIYPKVVSIIDSEESTTDILLRSLSVLDHGFYNANDALTVRSFLIGVMSRVKLRKVTCVCLTLSTRIAFTSLSHIHSQIELLIKMFLDDTRLAIKLNALKNLRFLAGKSPHIWQTSHVNPLISHLEQILAKGNPDLDDQCCHCILTICCELLRCKCNFISELEKQRIFKLCYKLSLNKCDMPLCSISFELLTIMFEEYTNSSVNNLIEQQSGDLTQDILTAIKAFLSDGSPIQSKPTRSKKNTCQKISLNVFGHTEIHRSASRTIYRQIVKLCRLKSQFCPEILKLLVTKISSKDTCLEELSPFVTELMCSITQMSVDQNISPDIYWKLIKARHDVMSETNLLNICVLYFQTSRLKNTQVAMDDLAEKVTSNHSLWFGFKVMRQAMRYGHHRVAKLICDELCERVTNDTTDFYFRALSKICLAESLLRQDNIEANLPSVISIYEESVSPLRASVGNSSTTLFQLQYLSLRIRYLQAHKSLRQCCKIYEATPITYTTLLSAIGATRGAIDPSLSKLSFIQQMPKIAKDFRYLVEGYDNLASSTFNCDIPTLDYVHLLKYSCIIMADAIDAIFQHGKNLPIISKMTLAKSGLNSELEHRAFEKTCLDLIELIRCDISKPGIFPSGSPIDPLISLLLKLSDTILKSPFIYPRYFFQPLQKTQIRLAISPQPTSSPVVVTLHQNLVLRVEGIIHDSSKPYAIVRKISKVIVSVNVTTIKSSEPDFNIFYQSISAPKNNYFKTEFLVPMRHPGSFNVEISLSIIDDQDFLWKNGLKEKLHVNVA